MMRQVVCASALMLSTAGFGQAMSGAAADQSASAAQPPEPVPPAEQLASPTDAEPLTTDRALSDDATVAEDAAEADGLHPPEQATPPLPMGSAGTDAADAIAVQFERHDRNGDDMLQPAEFNELMAGLPGSSTMPASGSGPEPRFAQADTDRNGAVSAGELAIYLNR